MNFLIPVIGTALLIAGCTSPQPHAFGIAVPAMMAVAVLAPEHEPDSEPQYAEQPPCIHPGDAQKMHVSGTARCSRQSTEDVTYWTSRPDKYRTACKGTHKDYCDEQTGMIPHCHGFGKWRFCHAHPGGGGAHDHIHDQEYASNATPEPQRR
jgi:hypothetical protein